MITMNSPFLKCQLSGAFHNCETQLFSLCISFFFNKTNPLIRLLSDRLKTSKRCGRSFIPARIRPSRSAKVNVIWGRLGLLRCAVSSIATGDIWVSEERNTPVHQIMLSRPTRCLTHGNVQCVPHWPIKHVPEWSHPIRTSVRMSFFFFFNQRTRMNSL